MKRLLSLLCLFLFTIPAYAQANGKLQIHYMDVGQGDGAVLISPQGEILLFDNGHTQCSQRSVKYLSSLESLMLIT
jgi:competence protein ComEC